MGSSFVKIFFFENLKLEETIFIGQYGWLRRILFFLEKKRGISRCRSGGEQKNSNGIVKGRVSQRKNSLELNIDLDFEAMDYLVTKTTCQTCK